MSQSYKISDTYPVPRNLSPNPEYACILMNAYSGLTSELTAICQYIYHHICADENQNVKAGLRGIAIVEMHHLDMLGSCLVQLGAKPKFRFIDDGYLRNWDSTSIAYGNNLYDMIQKDIASEEEAIRGYEEILELIPEPNIQKLIQRIIKDEQLHLQLFYQYLGEVATR